MCQPELCPHLQNGLQEMIKTRISLFKLFFLPRYCQSTFVFQMSPQWEITCLELVSRTFCFKSTLKNARHFTTFIIYNLCYLWRSFQRIDKGFHCFFFLSRLLKTSTNVRHRSSVGTGPTRGVHSGEDWRAWFSRIWDSPDRQKYQEAKLPDWRHLSVMRSQVRQWWQL